MTRNFLKGCYGDAINVMMAAAGMNFKRIMNKWKKGQEFLAQLICTLILHFYFWNKEYHQQQNLKITF